MNRFALPAAVGGTLLLSLGLSWCRVARAPDDPELDAAAAHVRASFRAGDRIVALPHTQVGPRQRLGDLPLSEPLSLGAEDLVGVERVHLIETGAVGSEPSSRELLAELGKVAADERFGQVRVTTFDLPARHLLFDLRDEIERVRVTARYPDGQQLACGQYKDGRWICPRDSAWSWVGRATLAIDNQARECVWMHPLRARGELRIQLPPLPLEADAELVGHFGFTLDAAKRAAAPVRVRVLSGDEVVLSDREFPVEVGWTPLRLDLPPAVSQPLSLVVTTSNNGACHFCGNLHLLGGVP